MHVVVLDPGFEDLHSHHVKVSEGLLTHFNSTARMRLDILASQHLEIEAHKNSNPNKITPFFSTPCYTNRLKPLTREREQELAEQFASELSLAFKNQMIMPESCLFMHTFFSFHLLGLAIWLHQYGENFTGSFLLCGMFHPGLAIPHSKDDVVESQRYIRFKLAATYFQYVADRYPRLIATSCNEFKQAYEVLFEQQAHVHPIITYAGNETGEQSIASTKHAVLLYAGSVKQDKGLSFILESTDSLLTEFPDVNFVIHLNTMSPGIRDFADAKALLMSLEQKNNNLRCYFDELDNAKYVELFNNVNAIICSYDPQLYSHKTSGILWDAMCRKDTALICTEGTWLASEYRAVGGSPFEFNYNDYYSLKDSLRSWLEHKPPFIEPNKYFFDLVNSFPKWIEQQCVNLLENTNTG